MKRLRWVLFVVYCLFIVWYTVLSRQPSEHHQVEWRLLWSYREMFTGNPNWKKDVVQNLQNILFFIPFGLLFPNKRWWAVLITAIIFSTLIEIIQYIGGFGLAELDDVICNTLGAMVGFWIWLGLKKIIRSSDAT